MFRSRILWKVSAGLAFLVLLTGGLVGGWVALLPLADLGEGRPQLRWAVGVGVLAAVPVALALGFWLTRRITRPLRSITAAATALAAGDYHTRVEIAFDDELGELGRAFNRMGRELAGTLAMVADDRGKLQSILAGMVEGVVAVDRNERVMHMNEVAGRLLDVVPAAVAGQPIWQATRLHTVSESLAETLRDGATVERSIRRPGRTDSLLELRAAPLRDSEGGLAGAVVMLDDVTHLRHLETMRRDFVGNVSHELKTPITAIRGLVETLIDDPEAEEATRRRFLHKILDHALRMSSLVADLLSLSRLESQERPLELAPLDLRSPIREVVAALQPVAQAGEITLNTELPDQAIIVAGEHEALRQAVSNLLDNAIKYSRRGGRVTLRLVAENGRAMVAVEDDGPGIERRHLERIFERFYRVDKARSPAVGGTGLGLAIVKHIARALDGEVAVDSTPGVGSTFSISLPRSDGAG